MTAVPENAPATAGQAAYEARRGSLWRRLGKPPGDPIPESDNWAGLTDAQREDEELGARAAIETGAQRAGASHQAERDNGTGLYLAAIGRLSAALRGVCEETGTSTMAHHIARDALADLDQPQRLPDLRRERDQARAVVAEMRDHIASGDDYADPAKLDGWCQRAGVTPERITCDLCGERHIAALVRRKRIGGEEADVCLDCDNAPASASPDGGGDREAPPHRRES